MYHLKLDLPGLPRINTSDNRHWRVRQREKKDWYFLVWIESHRFVPESPLVRAQVRITRHSSSEPDYENLTQGGKHILDGLVRAGVLADDKPSVIGQPEYRWEKAPPRKGHVTVEVWER